MKYSNQVTPIDRSKPKRIGVYGPGLGLKRRLALWILLFSMLPVLIFGVICDRALKNVLLKGLEKDLNSAMSMKIRDVEQYFREMGWSVKAQSRRQSNRLLLERLIQGLEKSGLSPGDYVASDDWQRLINMKDAPTFRPALWDYTDAFLTDVKGNILYSITDSERLGGNVFMGTYENSALSSACRAALGKAEAVFSDYELYPDQGTEKALGYMIIRMNDTLDKLIGLLVVKLGVEDLNRIMEDHPNLGQTFELYLVGTDRRLRSDFGKRLKRKALNYTVATGVIRFPDTEEAPFSRSGKPIMHYKGEDDIAMLGMRGKVRIGGVHYALIGEIEQREVFGLLERNRQVFLLFTLILLIVVGIFSYILAERVVRPVLVMTDWAHQVATGDLSMRDIDIRDDEMGHFIHSFSQVVVFLKETAMLARSVASGDFTAKIEPRSASDELGVALEQMTRSLWDAAEAMSALAGGDFGVRVTVKGPDDLFAKSVNSMVAKIKSTHESNENQARMKSLQAELSEILRGDQTTHELSRNILSFFCRCFNASVGAFYIRDDSGECLRLYSGFACDKTRLPTVIKPGEGLLGQAMVEKKKIILDHCPDNYMVIHGISGDWAASSVLVFPFVREDKVEGVIEMGSLNALTNKEFEFLELVSESVSIALSSAVARVKMKELLDKTVKQTEDLNLNQEKLDGINRDLQAKTRDLQQTESQLRLQEAELRAANRDLIKQAEQLKDSEKRLRLKEEELISANAALEDRSMNLEEQKNAINEKHNQLEITQTELLEKSKHLEISSRYKSEFLANMSHELRTPLNSILIISRLLSENKDGNLSQKQVEFSRTILGAGLDLLSLIDDILDLSKIESGKLEIHVDKSAIQDFEEKIMAVFGPVCREKNIGLCVDLDKNVPEYVYVDFKRVDQVIKNLVANAVKFTSHGQVTVTLRIPDTLPPGLVNHFQAEHVLLLTVEDSGIGIPSDKLAVIFEAFKQADGAISRHYGGTGLGLSISRELVRLMGGDILVKSMPGKGSVFSVYIPKAFDPPAKDDILLAIKDPSLNGSGPGTPPDVMEKPSLDDNLPLGAPLLFLGKKMLIVDDDMRNVYALIHFLGDFGLDISVAKTGQECLDTLEQHPDMDLLVMDIMRPDMGGFEVLGKIRSQERFKPLPVIAMTLKNDCENTMETGTLKYLSKPVDMERLISFMKEMLT
ncbi:MAG: response regulator [Proteobacteria bacterium]|nr:response regulator [Pseudomonadota bacterium]